MSSIYSKIINQEAAIKQLELICSASVKPTSLIFSGRKGIGKEAVAHAFAQSLNCEKGGFYPCGNCSSCIAIENCDTRYINFLYPLPEAKNEKNLEDIYEVFDEEINKKIQDLLKKKKDNPYTKLIIPKANEIKINSIRRLKKVLGLTFPEVKRKVIIITEADKINQTTQNTLLKTLEETNLNQLFILVTDRPSLLLKTIISRSWEIKFSPIKPKEIIEHLLNKYPEYTYKEINDIILNKNYNLSEIFECLEESNEKISFEVFKYLSSLAQNKLFDATSLISQERMDDDKNLATTGIKKLQDTFESILIKDFKEPELNEFKDLFLKIDKKQTKEVIDFLIKSEELIKNNVLLKLIWINISLKINKLFMSVI